MGGKKQEEKPRAGTPPKKPKDVPHERASEEDVDAQLDEELEDSFPASDPPSLTQDPR